MKDKYIKGVANFTDEDWIKWVVHHYVKTHPTEAEKLLKNHRHPDKKTQALYGSLSENTIGNYHLPFGVAPNFLVDGELYCVPMVTEESSVVAAAYQAATFWKGKGGFSTTYLSTEKVGHVYFNYNGNTELLQTFFRTKKNDLKASIKEISKSMEARGGGVKSLELIDATHEIKQSYRLEVSFETCDAMGANFINSCLETIGSHLKKLWESSHIEGRLEVLMAILSNYTPNCRVKVEASCPVSDFRISSGIPATDVAHRFVKALEIAKKDTYRAVTHNKGIFNGIDALLIATGNDYRAVASAAHAYAGKTGKYRALTYATINEETLRFWIDIPISLGTIGGLTSLHPMAKLALDILGKPSAKKLMSITAAVGLAQNFAAIRALITTGIQKGHMKMHLSNLLGRFNASKEESNKAQLFFQNSTASSSQVERFLINYRNQKI